MDSSSSSSSSSPCLETNPFHLPRIFKFVKILGRGSYGLVAKCVRRDTKETVAVKIPCAPNGLRQEALMMRFLRAQNLDNFNIVRLKDEIILQNYDLGLVYELLDISLMRYMLQSEDPMRLEEIRTIIEQMATALDALQRHSVIHGDLKMDNIVLVDQFRQPLRVKLIDFGLAIFRRQARPGCILQVPYYRAPEIMLGLPFSEAIDIWSLGIVMAIMIFDFPLFPARMNYDLLRFITDLLGPAPEHLLTAGFKTRKYFKRTQSGQWILKTPREYWGTDFSGPDRRPYTFRSLDETKTSCLEKDNPTEADDRRECIDLLKAMLTWDAKERITPSGILNHPFITKSYLNSSSLASSCEPEPSTSRAQTSLDESVRTPPTEDSSTSGSLPSGVILVRPAPPICRIHQEETPDENETSDEEPPEDSEMSHCPAPISLGATNVGLDTEAQHVTFDTGEEQQKRTKKRNCFGRFWSWMKRTFGGCNRVDVMS